MIRRAVVIPAYNAGRTLPGVLERFPDELRDELYGVWIVDDGSRDETAEVIHRLASESPRVHGVWLADNRGYGGAMKAGLAAAREAGAEEVACVHADGQYAPEELVALFGALAEGLDLLQGSRIASGTGLSGGMPLYKYIGGRVLTAMENRVFGLRMTDYHSGYLVYGVRALAGVPFDALSDSFDFDLEVIACCRALGLRIGERPIPTHYGDEVSYLDPVRYGLRVLGVMGQYLRGHYHRLAKEPARHEEIR